MDGGGIVANMMRSGSAWRNASGRGDVFSRSSREEDDEEALKWAALEKLPTYDRVRRGILAASTGGREIDVEELGLGEKKKLIERLVRVAEEDNEKFLLKLKNRLDRVGIENPTIEVRFQNLDINAEAYVGGSGVPTALNFFTNKIEGVLNSLHILPSRKKPISINGHDMTEFVPQRTSAYISQHDLHIGEMTVRETLAFSARCQGVGTRYEMLTELSRREKAANIKPDPDIDMYMKVT